MNLSCSARMIKYLMFIFNLIFVITGIALIAVGTSVKTIYTDYSYFLNQEYFSLPNMLIATGSLIFFISFFGCCGAIKENWILLGIFSILMMIIFIFEFSAGIAGYVLRDKTANYIDSALKNNLYNYGNETHAIWDVIQSNFECCGVDGSTDWLPVFPNYSLPLSCCPAMTGTVGVFYCNNYSPVSTVATTTPAAQSTVTPTSATTNPTSNTSPSSISTAPSTSAITATTNTNTAASSPASSPTASAATTKATTHLPLRRRRAADDVTSNTNTTPNHSTSTPYNTGCKSAFGDYIRKHAVQIGGCAMGLAVIQLLGIFFSCHLVRQLKNGYYST